MTDLRRAKSVIERGIDEGLHLGAQLYVSREGSTVADLAFGEARAGAPMTPDTLMLWMSSIKPVTAIAIGQLYERGAIKLQDRVARHIPEFGCKGKDPITIYHVLTHTGGFRNAAYEWTADPWEQIIAQICNVELETGWTVGRDQGYHVASGWYVLAEIVRRIDGRPYSRYVREEVFEPIGMQDTWLGMPEDRHQAYGDRIAPMHFAATFKRPEPHRYWPWSASAQACAICRPGGSARGPIRELGKFYEAMLAGGRGVISQRLLAEITSRHTIGLMDRTFGCRLDRGLGVVIDSKQYGAPSAWYGTRCSSRTWGHGGYLSSVGFADPQHRVVAALAFNGMLEAEPAKHQERSIAVVDAVFEDLGVAV